MDIHQQGTLDWLAGLYMVKESSDLTIICEGREFPVHRLVVCSNSPVFAKEVQPCFEESKGQIIHQTYDADTVERMIQYLYKKTYTVPLPDTPKTVNVQPSLDHTTHNHTMSDATTSGHTMSGGIQNSQTTGSQTSIGQAETHQTLNRQATNSQSSPWTVHDALAAHVNVHGIGSYYQIPMLQKYAVERFTNALKRLVWLERDWSDCLKLVKMCYEIPRPEDRGMRTALISHTITSSMSGVLDWEKFVNFASSKGEGPVLAYFWMEMTKAFFIMARRNAKVANDLRTNSKDSATTFKQTIVDQTQRVQAAENELQKVQQVLSLGAKCYNCHKVFGNRIEKHKPTTEFPNPGLFVRCGICLAKN